MGRKPNQEGRKEYLENPRTHFRFSDASDFREVFPNDAVGNETYLKPATGGKRLGKGSFRIVAHLPNKYHDDRENYLNKMKGGKNMSRFMDGGSLPANRIRWDGASNAGAHLILHTKKGKRVEFYLVGLGDRNPRGAMVYATAVFPSEKTRKLVQCPVQVGFFGQSKSKPGEYLLTFQKPIIDCGKNLAKAGHVPESFLKPDKKGKTVKAAEGGDFFMSEENHTYFHTVTGTQDVQIMNSETQATERAYYNPSDAMVGDETLDGYQITDSSTVDLTSNQPTANYGAESMKDKSWKYLGDLHYSHNMGGILFPQMASNLSKTEKDDFMRFAEKISNKPISSSKLNCDHCNPNGDNIQRQVVSIFMATKPTSMTVGRKGNSSIAKFKKGEIISVGVSCANNVKDFKNAEGETATYSPSEEPDMVSSSSFEDPTNAHFSADCSCVPCGTCMAAEAFYAEGETVADVEATVEPANEPIAVAEGHSLDGYTPIDSLEEGAPIGHGVNQFFGSAETVEGALLDESTTNIGIEEGTSLDNFSGVDSVAVEAPLGHGVTQWYAENADGPRPVFNEDITGQDGPSASPTNSNFSAQGYNDRQDESIGMRRGRKSQSMKSRRDEASGMDKRRGRKYDDVGTMDKKFNAIVSHRNKKGRFNGNQSVHSNSTGKFLRQGADTAGYLQDGALSLDGYTPLESVDVDRTSYQPTQNYGADQEIDMSFKDSVKVGTGLSVGVAAGSILLGVAGMLSLGLLGSFMGKGE